MSSSPPRRKDTESLRQVRRKPPGTCKPSTPGLKRCSGLNPSVMTGIIMATAPDRFRVSVLGVSVGCHVSSEDGCMHTACGCVFQRAHLQLQICMRRRARAHTNAPPLSFFSLSVSVSVSVSHCLSVCLCLCLSISVCLPASLSLSLSLTCTPP